MDDLIKINVGGSKFYAEKSSLVKYPATKLGNLDFGSRNYVSEKGYFFFNRNPEAFQMILDYYRFGSIHIPGSLCGEIVRRELTFWEIPVEAVAECCRSKFLKSEGKLETIQKISNAIGDKKNAHNINVDTKNKWLRRIWLFLEEPSSSKAAKINNLLYLLIVWVSVIMAFLMTYPGIKVPFFDLDEYKNLTYQWEVDWTNPKAVAAVTTTLPQWWYLVDRTFLGYFTIEFLLRLVVSPSKCDFLTSFLNILDIILNITMWFRVVLENLHDITMKYDALGWALGISYCVISLRLFRFFRISKQYNELRVLLLSLRASCKELMLLLVTFMILALIFANFIYYAEFNEPTTFPTAFSGVWWSVITLTTVGYGDSYPTSVAGEMVGSACATCGLIFLALPIAIIAAKFNEYYNAMKDHLSFRKHIVNVNQGTDCVHKIEPI